MESLCVFFYRRGGKIWQLLIEFFPEFRKYEGMCKFNGCDHVHEPGCAVKAAQEEDKIHKIRYQNYIEMYEEVKNKRRY